MIHVVKKELQERKFTPYQVIITIDSEQEHNQLQKEINNARSDISGSWYRRMMHDSSSMYILLESILKHTK